MYKTILVSLDGSLAAEAALWEVEKLLSIQPAKVVLLTIEPTIDFAEVEEEMRSGTYGSVGTLGDNIGLLTYRSEAHMRHYLEATALRLNKAGAETTIEVSFRKPADEIVFFANHYKVDLVVMATHGRKGWDHLLHGSVTESVLRRVDCPMLIVQLPKTSYPRFALNTVDMPERQ